MNVTTATIADVESALADYKAEAEANPDREKLDAKKLAAAVNALTLMKNVGKELKQAFNHAESKWSTNVLKKEADRCTKENKAEKVMEYIMASPAYNRHYNDPKSKARVEKWLSEDFPKLVAEGE